MATTSPALCGKPDYVVKNNLGLCTNGWGADWNDGFGFLSQIVDSRVIRPTGGSSNTSVRIPEVDKMLDEAIGGAGHGEARARCGVRSTSGSWRRQ